MKLNNAFRTISAISLLLIFVTACEPKSKETRQTANDAKGTTVKEAKDANDAVLVDRDQEKDADFIVNVVADNYAEARLAQLALTRSADVSVKKTATMLKAGHAKIISELKGYAAKNGITVPLEETADAKRVYSNLAEEKELDDFNEKWCDELADNHEESINYFERRLEKTEDVELKNWINSTLPGLRSHLAMLRTSEKELNN